MNFDLHTNFASKEFLLDLPLCTIFLENNRHYPWLLLIPRQPNLSRIMDLSLTHQIQLIQEMDLAQKALWDAFKPAQLNVAAIGNKTPQLHIHVIARFENDPAWPGTVWDHPSKEAYSPEQLQKVREKLLPYLKNTKAC